MKKLLLLLAACFYRQQTQAMLPELFRAYQACGKKILKMSMHNFQFEYQEKISRSKIVTGIGLILLPPTIATYYIIRKTCTVIDE